MQLSRTASHALHALAYLAARGEGAPVAAHVLAGAVGIPGAYVLKVLAPLAEAGLLRGRKGPGGGYRLARPPAEVTLLEVVEAIQGPIRGEAPVPGGGRPTELDTRLAGVCDDVAAGVRRQLAGVRLADLVGG